MWLEFTADLEIGDRNYIYRLCFGELVVILGSAALVKTW